MQNHSEIAEFLWKIADLIKDDYDAKNYEDVILPFTLLRRLDCVLQPTRQAVREAAEKYKAVPEQTRDLLLTKAAGQRFYNTSEYSLDELIRRPAVMVKKKLTENQAIFFRLCSFSYAIGVKYPRVEWSRMLL